MSGKRACRRSPLLDVTSQQPATGNTYLLDITSQHPPSRRSPVHDVSSQHASARKPLYIDVNSQSESAQGSQLDLFGSYLTKKISPSDPIPCQSPRANLGEKLREDVFSDDENKPNSFPLECFVSPTVEAQLPETGQDASMTESKEHINEGSEELFDKSSSLENVHPSTKENGNMSCISMDPAVQDSSLSGIYHPSYCPLDSKIENQKCSPSISSMLQNCSIQWAIFPLGFNPLYFSDAGEEEGIVMELSKMSIAESPERCSSPAKKEQPSILEMSLDE